MSFIQELKWRGMIHDFIPGLEEQLSKESTTAYVGIDPTADSLHIGNLVQIMTMIHFQRNGHKPILLVGGATGMVGDPSGKDSERKLLSEDIIKQNMISHYKMEHKKIYNYVMYYIHDEKLNIKQINNEYSKLNTYCYKYVEDVFNDIKKYYKKNNNIDIYLEKSYFINELEIYLEEQIEDYLNIE